MRHQLFVAEGYDFLFFLTQAHENEEYENMFLKFKNTLTKVITKNVNKRNDVHIQ